MIVAYTTTLQVGKAVPDQVLSIPGLRVLQSRDPVGITGSRLIYEIYRYRAYDAGNVFD